MPLTSGTRVGSYEVLSSLGAGGMGEVYRARDIRLERDVAIKVVTDLFSADPERLARFEREAKTLAALNHPNIAQIHGVLDVPDSAGRGHSSALVMEFVDGETLAARITRGALPPDDAIPIARQIAEALEAAHEAGIVHRDLKPANVKIRPDGTVKVLDFGLAKALGNVDRGSGAVTMNLANSPTFASPTVTGAGMIIGTAAYMAPEQARGKPADARADIWAFGVVFFEMLTGRQLFEGATISDVLAAVLRDGPRWESLPAGTPASVRTLLRRCLQKDPQLRLQHAGDARIELTDPTSRDHEESRDVSRPRVSRPFLAVAAALVALTGAGGYYAGTLTRDASDLPVRKFVIPQESSDGDDVWMRENMPAISPDGSRVAYPDGSRLLIRDLASLQSREVSVSGLAGLPTWSPDGTQIAFFLDHRSLWRASASDGRATKICDLPPGLVFGIVWQADRTILLNIVYGPRGGELFSVAESGGRPERYAVQGAQASEAKLPLVFYLRGLPDGAIAYATVQNSQFVTVVERKGEAPVTLKLPQNNGVTYAPSGHLLYTLRDGTPGVFAVPFDLASVAVTGEPFRIAEAGVGPAASSDGTLVFGMPRPGSRQLSWVDRDGTVRAAIGQAQESMWGPAISPDGSHVAVAGVENGRPSIWTHEVARAVKSRVTFNDIAVDPAWHPTDGRLAYQSGNWDVLHVSADGGDPHLLVGGPEPEFQPVWSRDGKYLVFGRFGPETQSDLWMLEAGAKEPRPLVQGRFDEMMPSLSPDAQYLAYVSDETGRREVFVRDFPSGQNKRQVSFASGAWPRWSPRGDEIFYVERNDLMAAPVRTQPSFSAGAPKRLFDVEERAISFPLYDTRDGQRFAIVRTLRPPRNGIAVVQNWAAEFTR